MTEQQPDKKQSEEKTPAKIDDTDSLEPMRGPVTEDLQFIIKGSLSLLTKLVHDLDWLLTQINSRKKN